MQYWRSAPGFRLGKRALGLYSPMKPIHPGRWMPLGKRSEYLVLNKLCTDCRRSKECACINSITPIQVKDKIDTYFSEVMKEREKPLSEPAVTKA